MAKDHVTIGPEFRPDDAAPIDVRVPGRRWIGVVAVVVAAVAIGWLLWDPGVDEPARPSVSGSFGSELPLGELVPGFVDTVTMMTWGNGGVDIVRWRPSDPAPDVVMSFDHRDGSNRAVDASGIWVVEVTRDGEMRVHAVDGSGVVWGGPGTDPGPGLRRSAVWHDTHPGRLAWLACPIGTPDAATILGMIDVSAEDPRPMSRPLHGVPCDDRAWLVRWGGWGYLLHVTEGSGTRQILVDGEGETIADGFLGPDGVWFVGTGSGGATVWTHGPRREGPAPFVLSPDGLDRRPVPGIAEGERLEMASASPDGVSVALIVDPAVSYGSAVRIVDLAAGRLAVEIAQPRWWVGRMTWSGDGRFLVFERWPDETANWAGVPRDVELVVFDTRSGSGVALPLPGYAAALRSRSLAADESGGGAT